MAKTIESFSEDLNIAFTNVHVTLEQWGLGEWKEYLVVRLPGKQESFIVLAHPDDKSDFADRLTALHKYTAEEES